MDDGAELAELMTELGYPTEPDQMTQRLEELLPSPDYHCIVADVGGALVGMVGLTIGRYFEKDGVYGRIVALVVAESHRGNGIGSKLLDAGERWLRRMSVRAVYVNSGAHRLKTHEFYEARGYARTGFRFGKELTK